MIQYKRCSEVSIDLVYGAFKDGFSDYIIKMDVSKEDFIQRFFGPEGNSLEHSFLALDGDKSVGIILGGIKVYETIKTMRCGTLAVHPEFRGIGVSQKLFELHKEEAIQNECQQLFLEVIVGNDRAIQFYNKLGYEKVYDLSYYNLNDVTKLTNKDNKNIEVQRLEFQTFKLEIQKWLNFHINWQNDIDYIEKTNNTYYGAYVDNDLKGSVCVNEQGKISYIFVDKDYRNIGIGMKLLQVARVESNLSSLSISFPNNSLLEGFLKKSGFKKNSLAQYEMYLLL
ncbi:MULTISPECIES: GNAT family N-acetyltransferase [Bacillus]|uniref:GNAT family N-acetyltransferase n=1 Tax=Bacillus TaxID=1386 RepID=UPI000B43D5A6|nr:MULTISPECIES: GNAT family N-acetyltransferase [Bacillus]OTX40133.1 GNAT family N-acetyltransferase [Bacillus thuringiensis serovar malayensis]OUB05419.1 GNAT family N-acetyltransferase [Bacillus thuringiensis serovar shandongiensis]AXK18528.1 GNAT family N-acetyltransferase [Bacillus sp. COPE52]MBJ8078200.1 GNAT family N-acetyltransferase [Bacillus cereus group sp. N12]MBJ8096603.1 GNAT family N-acetyltransferase [Bacillus cereus group sp. N11]